MNRFFTLLLAASCLTGVGQVTYPYNPDGNADGDIAVGDLQDFLTVYGNPFSPSEIMVGDSSLTYWVEQFVQTIESQQSQINQLLSLQLAAQGPCQGQHMLQYHGEDYDLVEIGNQCWFAENLKTLQTRDGVAIPQDVTSQNAAWSYFDNDPLLAEVFGVHYNYPAAILVCPQGWHLPTDEERDELIETIYRRHPCCDVSGMVLKTNSTTYPEWGGNNSTGFNALPSGLITTDGFSLYLGERADWWFELTLQPEYLGIYGAVMWLTDVQEEAQRGATTQTGGRTVRCIKDTE